MKTRALLLVFIALSILSYLYLFYVKRDDFYQDFEVDKQVVDDIIRTTIKEDMTDYEKVKAIHDYIILTTTYDIVNLNRDTIPDLDYTAKGVLENKIGVCRGYAEAFLLLMNRLGIECDIITGYAENLSHAWNVVKINEKWYQIDCTYDDPLDHGDDSGISDNLRYDYFLVTDQQMYLDHTPDYKSKEYHCTDETYLYQEKLPGIPYHILKSAYSIPASLIQEVEDGKRAVTYYFPDIQDLETTQISDKIGIALGRNGHHFSTFTYTPVQRCGDYFYTTISVR